MQKRRVFGVIDGNSLHSEKTRLIREKRISCRSPDSHTLAGKRRCWHPLMVVGKMRLIDLTTHTRNDLYGTSGTNGMNGTNGMVDQFRRRSGRAFLQRTLRFQTEGEDEESHRG
jgi:hypothetical protein